MIAPDQALLKKLRISEPYECPRVVCLCGSTRFYKEFQKQNYIETMKGHIVLSVGFYPHAQDEVHGEQVGITPEQKEKLDLLHLRKIDACDEVFVLNVDGYIGESTANEIAYAFLTGKSIRFLEPGYYRFVDREHYACRVIFTI